MNQPLAISTRQCAQLLGCSVKHVYALIKSDPTFPRPWKLGRSTRLQLSELKEWTETKATRADESWRAEHTVLDA